MKPSKDSLTELYNVLLKLEPEFPASVHLCRHGSQRELWILYKDLPNVFFRFGPDENIQACMVVPREMLELKEGRGQVYKNFIRLFVETIRETMEEVSKT